jgi:hypothetical protein
MQGEHWVFGENIQKVGVQEEGKIIVALGQLRQFEWGRVWEIFDTGIKAEIKEKHSLQLGTTRFRFWPFIRWSIGPKFQQWKWGNMQTLGERS